MVSKSADEILGLEFDWLCSDADGHVALFSTAGGGYAPEEFLRDTDAHDAAIDAILASPTSTVARFAPELSQVVKNTWLMVAERGLFAFDSDAHGGPYCLVAAPEVPVRIEQLPMIVSKTIGGLEFRHLRFVELFTVAKDQLQQR